MAGIRDTLNNPKIGVPVAGGMILVALIVFVIWLFSGSDGSDLTGKQWYYDLKTETRFVGEPAQTPPIQAPSGGQTGVIVFVKSCDGCDTLVDTYVQTLSEPAQEARKKLDAMLDSGNITGEELTLRETISNGTLVKRPGDNNWVPFSSSEGQKIVEESMQICGPGKIPADCLPD